MVLDYCSTASFYSPVAINCWTEEKEKTGEAEGLSRSRNDQSRSGGGGTACAEAGLGEEGVELKVIDSGCVKVEVRYRREDLYLLMGLYYYVYHYFALSIKTVRLCRIAESIILGPLF